MLLGLALLVAPPSVGAAEGTVANDAAVGGLTTRVGAAADDWVIEVGPLNDGRAVVTMTAPDGWVLDREVTLDAEDPEARARQLAASVAVVIENYEPREDPPDPPPPADDPPPPTPRGPIGFVAAGAQLSTGPASRAGFAAGATLAGGVWLLRDHVLPLAEVGWRRSSAGELTIDGANIDAGVVVGGPLFGGRVWLGGGAVAGALGGFARDSRSASAWSAHITAPAMLLVRLGPVFAELHAGPELTLPPLSFRGNANTVRWGHLRASMGLRIGLLLGPGARFGFRKAGSV